jgi:hypothetical protein
VNPFRRRPTFYGRGKGCSRAALNYRPRSLALAGADPPPRRKPTEPGGVGHARPRLDDPSRGDRARPLSRLHVCLRPRRAPTHPPKAAPPGQPSALAQPAWGSLAAGAGARALPDGSSGFRLRSGSACAWRSPRCRIQEGRKNKGAIMMNRWHPDEGPIQRGKALLCECERSGWAGQCGAPRPLQTRTDLAHIPWCHPERTRHAAATHWRHRWRATACSVHRRCVRGASDGAGARLDMLLRHCLRCHSF